mmetsp:Transcript_28364/g.59125  ORF Transcript_28364/g.59125 Transcript_28364/m.59125 type:complete len:497 (-) Transcript_28364:418-1908(-)
MHVQRGDVTTPRKQSLDHDLLDQVIHSNVLLGRHKEKGLLGVETSQLGLPSLRLSKRLLRCRLGELVDEDGGRTRLGGHGGEVIPLAMPLDGGHVLPRTKEGDGSRRSSEGADGRPRGLLLFSERDPPDGLGGAGVGGDVPSVLALRRRGEQGARDLRVVQACGSRGDDHGALSDGREEDVVGSIGVPFEGCDRLLFLCWCFLVRFILLSLPSIFFPTRPDHLRQIPTLQQSTTLHLPQPRDAILSTTRQKLPVRTHRQTPHHHALGLPGHLVPDALGRRKRPQIARPRQLRHQALRIDIQPPLHRAGTQVEVETTLEALLDRVLVRAHAAQIVEFPGNEVPVGAILGVEVLPLLQFRFVREVFLGGVVAEGVSGGRDLGRGHVLRSLSQCQFVFLVALPEREGFVVLILSAFDQVVHVAHLPLEIVHVDATALQSMQQPAHLQLLPLGRLESRFLFVPIRIQTGFFGVDSREVVDVVRVGIVLRVRERSALQSTD